MESTQPIPGRARMLIGLVMTFFSIAFTVVGLATALPTVMQDLGALALYAWAFSTIVIGMLLSTLMAGRMADRVGPLLPMVAGYVLFATGLLMGALAPNVWVLLVGRLVQGLGAGALVLGLFVSIALSFDGSQRAKVMGALSFVWLLPAFIGPPIAAWLTSLFSWRVVFGAILPVLAMAALLTLPALRNVQAGFIPSETQEKASAWWAVAMVVLSPVLIQLVGEDLGFWGYAAGLAGVVSLAIGLPRVLPRAVRLFSSALGSLVLTRGLMAGGFFAAEAYLLLVLQELRGLTVLEAGLALTIGSIGWSTGSWMQSRPWVRLRRDQLITASAVLSSLGLLIMTGFILFSGAPLAMAVLGWVVSGFGMGIMMPSTAVAVMGLSNNQEQGRNSSAVQVVEGLGNALFTGIAGAVYAISIRALSQQTSFVSLFAALTVLCITAVLVSRRIGPITNDSLTIRG